jgi:hypothetical protein
LFVFFEFYTRYAFKRDFAVLKDAVKKENRGGGFTAPAVTMYIIRHKNPLRSLYSYLSAVFAVDRTPRKGLKYYGGPDA